MRTRALEPNAAPSRVTRFAPSPTGDLHLGGAWTALASWALARADATGRTVVRVEDIDTPRVVRGAAPRILEDLAWLGLDWDEDPWVQSERLAVYEDALARLPTYPCDCSRKEIAQVASAPHAGDERAYPGTCRDLPVDRAFKRPPALRLRVPAASRIAFDDLVAGHVEEDVARVAGDLVLRRGDDVFAYQLVVAVDDAAAGVTHVVRADDLRSSTARQILILKLLGYADAEIPRYAHVPLVVAPDGERLAKRAGGATVRSLRERGVSSERIVGELARGLGLVPPDITGPLSPREVAARLQPPARWRKTPWPLPPDLA
jgi:glutamyl-tRNA synthetase